MTRIAIEHGWEIAIGSCAIDEIDRLEWKPATVPGTAAGALGVGNYDDVDVWWRAPMGGELTAGCVLGLDGIATVWDAWLDGVHLGSGDSMWERREFAIAHPVRHLVIRCRSLTAELAKKRVLPPRARWKVPMLEQQQLRWIRTTLLGRTPGWSPPYPAVGPWRGVWLETAPRSRVAITARVEGSRGVLEVAGDGEVVVTRGAFRATGRTRIEIDNVELWWPHTHGEPALYEVAIDGHVRHVGFRTISFDNYQLRVNGVDVFCRGACWTPLHPVTLNATRAEYAAAIAQMREAGMNMLRVGGTMTYEDDALYDALDTHGILLWQDLMFANMDYPDDAAFTDKVKAEVDAEVTRLQARPSLAVICGNSEGEQQAAMWGAPRERWAPALFHEIIPAVIAGRAAYVPSSTHGGAFPHASNVGPSSYYGVGAYLRPLEDARRAEVVFATECLAFANIPAAIPWRVHSPEWKQRSPRDLGAGWDFDDVRDHYVKTIFGVDPNALRVTDHDRYLELGRMATGEAMARTFGEWRRARSVTRGALIWFLRDLWPGAGWGVVDAQGQPKACWYALRRALAPIAIAITDEGTNGLALHIHNETARSITRSLELALWRGGETLVGRGAREVTLEPRASLELNAAELFENFYDLSYAYRFGPPGIHAIHASYGDQDEFWFPAGMPATREPNVGLSARRDGDTLYVRSQRFAQFVTIDLPGYLPADDAFHLAPGQERAIALRNTGAQVKPGTVQALNSEAGAKIE